MPRSSKISVFEIIADSSLTGAPRHLLTLLSGINRYKFVVSVIVPEGDLVKELKKLKVPVFTVPMKGRADLAAISAISRILKKYEPDIVHTHGQRAGVLGRLATSDLKMRRIHTEHTYTSNLKLDNPVLHWTHINAMRVLAMWTNKTIAVSDAVRAYLTSAGISKPEKVVTIHNGIAPLKRKPSADEIKRFRANENVRSSEILIGTIGSFNRQKDTATLVKAFGTVHHKWANTKLLLIGKGELKRNLEQLVAKLDLKDSVHFAGTMDDVTVALASLDLFVLPSRSEAFGLTLLEAMQANVPIIASKVGGIPEIIHHGYNGLLVEHDDPKQLSAAMLKLLNDKKLQKKFTSHYPETLKNFSATKMVQATESVYEELVNKK